MDQDTSKEDTAVEVTPYVIFPERTTDVLQPFVLDVHSPTRNPPSVAPDKPEPVEYLRSTTPFVHTSKSYILNDDGTITDHEGNLVDGFVWHRSDDHACRDDDAGYAHSDPPVVEDSAAAAPAVQEAPFDALDQQAESRPEPNHLLPPD